MAEAFFFYLFAGFAVASAVMVVSARNPVYSVLFLILCFFNAAGLFIMLGAEFLAMILIVVYVGAVTVLFLFVVMMLDIDFVELRQGFLNYLPIGSVVGFVMLVELILVVGTWQAAPQTFPSVRMSINNGLTNTEAIGRVLYTHYVYYFEGAGLVLLVAMIGAIVLTLRHKTNVKRQDISRQVSRTPEAVRLVNVKPGQGIE